MGHWAAAQERPSHPQTARYSPQAAPSSARRDCGLPPPRQGLPRKALEVVPDSPAGQSLLQRQRLVTSYSPGLHRVSPVAMVTFNQKEDIDIIKRCLCS